MSTNSEREIARRLANTLEEAAKLAKHLGLRETEKVCHNMEVEVLRQIVDGNFNQ